MSAIFNRTRFIDYLTTVMRYDRKNYVFLVLLLVAFTVLVGYYAYACAVGAVIARCCGDFSNYHKMKHTPLLLTLPVSNFEKYVANYIINLILLPVILFVVTLIGVEMIQTVFDSDFIYQEKWIDYAPSSDIMILIVVACIVSFNIAFLLFANRQNQNQSLYLLFFLYAISWCLEGKYGNIEQYIITDHEKYLQGFFRYFSDNQELIAIVVSTINILLPTVIVVACIYLSYRNLKRIQLK